jgi:hypothetical protein
MDHRIILTEQHLLTARRHLRNLSDTATSAEEWELHLEIKRLEYELDNLKDIATEHTPAPTA